jgi:hypothetical protein
MMTVSKTLTSGPTPGVKPDVKLVSKVESGEDLFQKFGVLICCTITLGWEQAVPK